MAGCTYLYFWIQHKLHSISNQSHFSLKWGHGHRSSWILVKFANATPGRGCCSTYVQKYLEHLTSAKGLESTFNPSDTILLCMASFSYISHGSLAASITGCIRSPPSCNFRYSLFCSSIKKSTFLRVNRHAKRRFILLLIALLAHASRTEESYEQGKVVLYV